MRHAISVGIGLFIAFVGLQNANIVIGGSTLALAFSMKNYRGCMEEWGHSGMWASVCCLP